MLTQEQIQAYHDDGYLIVKSLFDAEEIELLGRTAVADRQMNQKSFGRADGEGGTVRLTLWNHPGNGIYGMYGPLQSRRQCDGAVARRRGLPLPLENDSERSRGRRRLGVAPGLRLLV